MTSSKFLRLICVAGMAFSSATAVTAQSSSPQIAHSSTFAVPELGGDRIAAFVPQAQANRTRLDYAMLNDALNYSVLPLGVSTRRHMSKPDFQLGSRIRVGHQSPYRLEGSRVSFSLLNDEYKEALHAYRLDLERVGNEIDIVRMNRNEQLAFWLNLHNIVMIDEIVKNYPVKRPSRMKVNGVPVDEAKLMTIKGQQLSLRDIRERIVYPNWKNPNVIYGFFRGDIGSPALQDFAFTASNVGVTLDSVGGEFVNALRGFNETSKTRNVSKVYDEARRFYFPDFDADLTRHLLTHARVEVQEEIRVAKPIKIGRYDDIVADLVGGSRTNTARATVTDSQGNQLTIPLELASTLRELDRKRQVLKRRDLLFRNQVIIEDIVTSDQQFDPNVDPASSVYNEKPKEGF